MPVRSSTLTFALFFSAVTKRYMFWSDGWMAARCHAFNPIHCNPPQPPPCLLLLLLISGSDSERELERRSSTFRFLLFLFLHFPLVEIWIPLGWCWCEQLSPRWQTLEIKPGPRFRPGHQRMVDSSALFTHISLSPIFYPIHPPSVFLSLLLHTPAVISFSSPPPLMVSFSPEQGKRVFFL